MSTELKIAAAVLLLMMLSGQQRKVAAAQARAHEMDYMLDPTTWGLGVSDQWARLYGDDLMDHGAQYALTPYGVSNYIGFQR